MRVLISVQNLVFKLDSAIRFLWDFADYGIEFFNFVDVVHGDYLVFVEQPVDLVFVQCWMAARVTREEMVFAEMIKRHFFSDLDGFIPEVQ